MKMKSSGRYAVGWTDYRNTGPSYYGPVHLNILVPTEFASVPTETLRALWLVRFNTRAVSVQFMHSLDDASIVGVAQELANRGLVDEDVLHSPEYTTDQHYYILKQDSDGNN